MNSTEINTTNRQTTVNTPNSSSVVTTTSRSTSVTPNRQAAVNTLAVVGFIALIAAAMWLAVYSTRYVPGVVNRIGSAAVYLGSVFTPGPASLSVVPTPTASTTISFGTSSSTVSTNTVVTTSPKKTPTPTTADTTYTTYTTGGTQSVTPYGLPDLAVTITSVGYLASDSSFVASPTVPSGSRPVVKFSIENTGTNWTGTWRFSVDIPLSRSPRASDFEKCEVLSSGVQHCTSYAQPSLNPGGGIDYTIYFNQASTGTGQQLTITANFDHVAPDSNATNDTATAYINVI